MNKKKSHVSLGLRPRAMLNNDNFLAKLYRDQIMKSWEGRYENPYENDDAPLALS